MNIDPEMYKKYPKERIEEALAKVNYKNVKELPKDESPGHPILYVFRHGQTTDNEKMVFSGWRNPELTEKGREKALVLAEKLKDKKIDMLVASDQIRSIDTMKLAMSLNKHARDLEINKEPRIKERNYGDLQGTSKFEMYLKDEELTGKYRRNYYIAPPNGENLEAVVKRVTEFINEIVPKMKEYNINVAVACHGNSIRGFRQYFEKLTNEQTATIESPLAEDYAAYQIV